MSDISVLTTPGPYHIVAYGTLLGMQIQQSFIGGVIAFKSLPRAQFSSLQQKMFPVYFSMQTTLPAVLALTYPGSKILGSSDSLSGTFDKGNRWSVLFPLATVFTTGLINLVFVGPATTKIMKERKHQETRDGKKSYDPAPHSKEMQKLNRAFGKMHGASSMLNLVAILATVWYSASLAERLV